jgi:hypothetical protein
MLGHVVRTLAIIALAVGLAAVYVQARGLGWTPDPIKVEQERNAGQKRSQFAERFERFRNERGITIDELQAHIAAESIIVDARDPAAFAAEHLKAPVILNIFGEAAAQPENVARLSPEVVAGRPIVIYCNSEDCDLSDLVYIALDDAYPAALDFYIYVPGWEGIKKAGLETTTGPETDFNAPAATETDIPVNEAGTP